MKRALLVTCCIWVWALSILAQPITLQCHVEDAVTGEALPYVSIFVSKSNTTISNHEGDFTIVADAKETVRLSYVGYETQQRVASEIPDTIRMQLQERTLHQLTVMPIEGILMAVKDRLNKEFLKKRKQKDQYFCRLTTRMGEQEELTEAFLEARSAINLRELTMLSGRRGKMTRYGMMRPELSDVNLQHALETGPMMQESDFWNNYVRPIPVNAKSDYFRKHYSLMCEVLIDSTGRKTYCIDMQRREGSQEKGLLIGKVYVDAKTYQLLHFEGEVTDLWMDVTKNRRTQSQRVEMKLSINYTLRDGFTEVDDISCEIGRGELHTQTILHNVSNLKIKFRKHKAVKENMLSAIDAAGFDSTLWEHAGIVRRTPYEEHLAQQQATFDQAAIVQHTGNAQLDGMVDRLRLFGQRLPQEKVYLHLDNTCYFLGDTIWYAAYSRRTSDNMPSDISNVLYVELLNNDGYVMERQVVKMKDGRGHGNIYLDPEYYAGFYEMRAYTRWQLNWGISEREHGDASKGWFMNEDKEHEFFRDYDKLYSRVVPVYDKPADPSVYDLDMTLRPMRRYYKHDPNKRELQLTLFPEGGNLVEGLPCNIAFEAAWNDGEWVDGELHVDSLVIPALHRGRGVFSLTPARKMPQASFVTTKGEKIKVEWPEVLHEGAVLSMAQGSDRAWSLQVHLTEGLSPDSLCMTIMNQGVLKEVLPIRGKDQSFQISEDGLEIGVNQVTLFDTQGRVWADRLFFVRGEEPITANISVTGIKDEYRSYEPISLDIQAAPNLPAARQPISLSVRDTWNQNFLYDNASMLTEMLLSSEIKGFVPQPDWYFEQDDDVHRQALDLLMLTQGWRRFAWRDMAVSGTWELRQPDEKSLVVDGTVEPYLTADEIKAYMNEAGSKLTWQEAREGIMRNKKSKALLLHSELVDPATNEAVQMEMEVKNNGHFRLKLPDFDDRAYFFLSAADPSKIKDRKNHAWIQMAWAGEDMPSDRSLLYHMERATQAPDYMSYISLPYPRYAKRYTWHQTHLAPMPEYVKSKGRRFNDGTIELNEVSITAKHNGQRRFKDSEPAFMVDAYEAFNNAMDAGLSTDHEGIARSYIGDLGLDNPFAWDVVFLPNGKSEQRRTSRIKLRLGLNLERRFDVQGLASADFEAGSQEDLDTLFHRDQLWSMERLLENVQPGELRYYMIIDDHNQPTHSLDIFKLEKFIIYTDYCPRLIGDGRYEASNLPDTKVAAYPYADGGRRPFYRDRRYVIQGFNVADEFYHPDYSQRPLPEDGAKDYRRTLYWNPDLQLDDQGHAHVSFYNCSRNTQLSVTAEGMTKEGVILTGKEEK